MNKVLKFGLLAYAGFLVTKAIKKRKSGGASDYPGNALPEPPVYTLPVIPETGWQEDQPATPMPIFFDPDLQKVQTDKFAQFGEPALIFQP